MRVFKYKSGSTGTKFVACFFILVIVSLLGVKSVHTYNHASECLTHCCHNCSHHDHGNSDHKNENSEDNHDCKICHFEFTPFQTSEALAIVSDITIITTLYALYVENVSYSLIESGDTRAPPASLA